MRTPRLSLALAILAAASLLLAGCQKKEQPTTASGAGGAVNWKMASAYSATLPILGTSGVYFRDKVEQISGGRIKIQFFDPGKLVPALEVFDAVGKGQVDAGWSGAGFWVDKMPAAAFFSAVPFGPDTSEYLAWIYQGGGWDLWKELYAPHNVYPIPCNLLPPEASGWFRKPIDHVAQLKGMKIRFYGMGGQVLQKLGASVQLLAPGDIFPALERGVLDATEFSIPSIDEKLGFSKVAKHYYFPGWHQQASLLELIVNLDRWKALAPADQALIQTVCRDTIVRGIARGEAQQGPALEHFKQEGVQIHYWSDEMLTAFRHAYDEVVRETSAKDAEFKRVYESYKKFRDGFAEWRRLSRLPPGFR